MAVGVIATTGMLNSYAATDSLSAAKMLAGKWIIKSGSTAADFGLNQTITRKEIMKVVMNLSGKSVADTCNGSFGDVTNDWGCKYIEAALKNGFIAANPNFRPNDSISKAEAMKLVLKARGIAKAYNTSDWQNDYALTAYDNGIVSSKYTDHTTKALRGWIFSTAAAEIKTIKDSWKTMTDDKMSEKMMDDGDEMTEEKMMEHDTMMEEDSMMWDGETIEEASMMDEKPTGYLDYSSELIGKNDKTVLFFHATWCPSCNSADKNIKASWVDDFLLLKTDYDSNLELRKKYWVTTQHTFVRINSAWKVIKKWSGWNNVEDIRKAINL